MPELMKHENLKTSMGLKRMEMNECVGSPLNSNRGQTSWPSRQRRRMIKFGFGLLAPWFFAFASQITQGSGWQHQSDNIVRRHAAGNHHQDDGVASWSDSKFGRSATGRITGTPLIDGAASSGNETVILGKQVILRCVVDDLGNESVSWIRHSDSGLLAVNSFVYTTSRRIKVFHADKEWRLSINPAELVDTGVYECQVSTTPHTSHFIRLRVVEPETTIVGSNEMFIESGSTINITCTIHTGGQAFGGSHIYWNYNGKIITHDRTHGATIVIAQRPQDILTSLIISRADPEDSGKYTCDPTSSYAKSVIVHVTKGSDAAMRQNTIVQHAASSPISSSTSPSPAIFISASRSTRSQTLAAQAILSLTSSALLWSTIFLSSISRFVVRNQI